MERYTVFYGLEDFFLLLNVNTVQMIYIFNAISVKIPMVLFVEIKKKSILKFMWNLNGS